MPNDAQMTHVKMAGKLDESLSTDHSQMRRDRGARPLGVPADLVVKLRANVARVDWRVDLTQHLGQSERIRSRACLDRLVLAMATERVIEEDFGTPSTIGEPRHAVY